jgi:hypothetical protein
MIIASTAARPERRPTPLPTNAALQQHHNTSCKHHCPGDSAGRWRPNAGLGNGARAGAWPPTVSPALGSPRASNAHTSCDVASAAGGVVGIAVCIAVSETHSCSNRGRGPSRAPRPLATRAAGVHAHGITAVVYTRDLRGAGRLRKKVSASAGAVVAAVRECRGRVEGRIYSKGGCMRAAGRGVSCVHVRVCVEGRMR